MGVFFLGACFPRNSWNITTLLKHYYSGTSIQGIACEQALHLGKSWKVDVREACERRCESRGRGSLPADVLWGSFVTHSEAPLKLLHVYYNLTIYVLHTNRRPLYNDCLLMSRTKTNRRTDREQSTQDQMLRLPGFFHRWNRHKPKHAADPTQTSDEEWWRQQSDCWAPFKDETSNWLGLCDMDNVFYRLLSTSYFRKLVY